MTGFIFLTIIIACITLPFVALLHERKQARVWRTVATGIFDYAAYETKYYTTRSGAMAHSTSHHRDVVMAIYFDDGRSYEINGRCDVPYPKGSTIAVVENKLGWRRIIKHEN